MEVEKYWAQTRRKWQERVTDPYSGTILCGFCSFADGQWEEGASSCAVCPVVKVYGHVCDAVESVRAYNREYRGRKDVEELSVLAEAVVRELDGKKAELIVAMKGGAKMEVEKYWAQTRKKWAHRATDPRAVAEACGFCNFAIGRMLAGNCAGCPVVKVYGHICDAVEPVRAYSEAWAGMQELEVLIALAEAVVRELDDRKAELLAAMCEIAKGGA